MAKSVITPQLLAVGEETTSAVLEVAGGTKEFLFRAETQPGEGIENSQVQLVVEDLSFPFTSTISVVYLNNEQTRTFILDHPPTRLRIRASCLMGPCLLSVDRAFRITEDPELFPGSLLIAGSEGEVSPIAPPPPTHYFGTDSLGNIGYFPLPTTSTPHAHVWHEVPQGTINGTNNVFILANSPNPPDSLTLSLDGVLMRQGASEDFVLSGNMITYNSQQTPRMGSTHVASYVI